MVPPSADMFLQSAESSVTVICSIWLAAKSPGAALFSVTERPISSAPERPPSSEGSISSPSSVYVREMSQGSSASSSVPS